MLHRMHTFELPIRTGFLQNSNFSELNDDTESLGSPPSNFSKKVRFESSTNEDEKCEDLMEALRDEDDLISGKKNIEDLLQYANQVNDYVADNLEKISTFRADLLNGTVSTKPSSDMATQATTLSASMSNFELSDNESDNQDFSNDRMSFDRFNKKHPSSLDKNEKALLDTLPDKERTAFMEAQSELSLDYGTDNDQASQSNDCTLEKSPLLLPHQDSSNIIPIELDNNIKNLIIKSSSGCDQRNAIQDRERHSTSSLIIANIKSASNLPEYMPEQGIKILLDTLDSILQLSQVDICERENNDSTNSNDRQYNDNDPYNSDEYSNFIMKSAPSLTYMQLISRIQSKCMFGSIVYITAAFLLQTLLLTRSDPNGSIVLRHSLKQNETHRLVVASIRIATKLLEDCVHSHQYFCKVCGVSKKLLTRLEASLIICLKDDGLIINGEKLTASIEVSNELKQRNV